MFLSIFEVFPAQGKKDEYLELTDYLKPMLEAIDGFVGTERFESRLRPGWMLANQIWRDEKSVIRWRAHGEHHAIQKKGRFQLFQDYRVRVGEVIFDTDPPQEAPILEKRFDETEIGESKMATFTEIIPEKGANLAVEIDLLPSGLGLDLGNNAIVEHDVLDSINNPGALGLVVAWKNAEAAGAWLPKKIDGVATLHHRRIRIVRQYGRFDRREAPQFYPDVKGGETKHPEPAQ
jgi:heme-degrading monooxygenase HmoA